MENAGKGLRSIQLILARLLIPFMAGFCGLAGSLQRQTATEVMVLATVMDKQGHIPQDLSHHAFIVEEEGKECPVSRAVFGDRPAAVVLVFDISGSMGKPVSAGTAWGVSLQEAAKALMAEGHSSNLYMAMAAGAETKILHGFTRDTEELLKSLNVESVGRTALLDALLEAKTQLLRTDAGTRAIVLVSDGEENTSRASENDTARALSQAGITLCALVRPGDIGFGLDIVKRLVNATGGVVLQERAYDTMPSMASFARVLRHRYALFYTPPPHRKTKDFYSVRVKVREKAVGKGWTVIAPRKRPAQ